MIPEFCIQNHGGKNPQISDITAAKSKEHICSAMAQGPEDWARGPGPQLQNFPELKPMTFSIQPQKEAMGGKRVAAN